MASDTSLSLQRSELDAIRLRADKTRRRLEFTSLAETPAPFSTAIDVDELATVLEHINYGVMFMGSDLRAKLINTAFLNMWNVDRSFASENPDFFEMIEYLRLTGVYDVEEDAWPGYVKERLDLLLAADAIPRESRRADGRTLLFNCVPLPNHGRMLTYFDITDSKRTEELLEESNEELTHQLLTVQESKELLESQASELARLAEDQLLLRQQAEAAELAKSEFLASMSHEIRTPMTGVMGFADLLLENDLDQDSREKVYKIKDATRSLLRIINDILDMSKLEAGKVELEYLDFHLPSLVEDVAELFSEKRTSTRALPVNLESELAEDLPDAINLDPTRLRQVLVNLVGNAKKFTKAGSVTVKGNLAGTGAEATRLRFEIIDTGIGIKPEVLGELFTEFTQADASITRKFEGTGLGLSICKKLVTLMDGQIGVESTYGEGSTFWFELPFTPATTAVEKAGEKTKVVSKYAAARSLHILAVDDNGLNQEIIAAILEGFGHTYEKAENGMQALEMHEAGNFDLILMDVRMPVMSGPDATRIIRKMGTDKAAIPIIALTADAMEEHKVGYYEAGMDAVATKPIDGPALAIVINQVLGEEINVPVMAAAEGPTEPEPEPVSQAQQEEFQSAVDDFLGQIGADDD